MIARSTRPSMYKQKQYLAVVVKKRLSSVFLVVIMLFLPQFAFGAVTSQGFIFDSGNMSRGATTTATTTVTGQAIHIVATWAASNCQNGQVNPEDSKGNTWTAVKSEGILNGHTDKCTQSWWSALSSVGTNHTFSVNRTTTTDVMSILALFNNADEAATSSEETSTTTVTTIDESQVYFNGVVLFFMSMVFVVWYFRGRIISSN